jgi:hypothetical protein
VRFLFLSIFSIHAMIISQPMENEKPIVGFQARFFCHRPGRRKFLQGKGLRDNKPSKSQKARPHDVIFWARTARFPAKQGRFEVVFGCHAIFSFASCSP